MSVREGPRVTKSRFGSADALFDELDRVTREISGRTDRAPATMLFRELSPVEQVAARIEIAGPRRGLMRMRGGVDVRGDGSMEAYVGRTSRIVIELKPGETMVDALRDRFL
ncbi:MAG TPA: hypothetical protein VGO97_03935 [Solirubrobacterales bacterium]|jgi:hypothetical protein|nr:hypothetical protein [Solirubrobacterales bacterium]